MQELTEEDKIKLRNEDGSLTRAGWRAELDTRGLREAEKVEREALLPIFKRCAQIDAELVALAHQEAEIVRRSTELLVLKEKADKARSDSGAEFRPGFGFAVKK